MVAAGTLGPVVSGWMGGARASVAPRFFATFTAPIAVAILAWKRRPIELGALVAVASQAAVSPCVWNGEPYFNNRQLSLGIAGR